MRKLNEFEANLIAAQLSTLDGSQLKAAPVHPVQIRPLSVEDMRMVNAVHVPDAPLEHCAAGKDGECNHSPQLRDNEPECSGRHCPIDNRDEDND